MATRSTREIVGAALFVAVLIVAALPVIATFSSCDAECQKRQLATEYLRCQSMTQPKTELEAVTFGMRQIKEATKCFNDLTQAINRYNKEH